MITVPLSKIALSGISKVSLTCIQMFEYGNVLSRETAHSVREHVVPSMVRES